MSKEVRLTHEGISRLSFDKAFELKTDSLLDKDTIRCSRGQISFLSPTIAKMLINDPTINEYTFNSAKSFECVEILRFLLNGSSVTIPKSLVSTFHLISLELGNEELLSFVEESLTCENVLDITKIKHKISLNIEKEIEYIASYFYQFDASDISTLDLSILDTILGNQKLVTESEHDLFTFICDLVSTYGDEYRVLLSHLHLECLGKDDISKFINYINDDNVGSFLPCIYKSLLCSPTYKEETYEKKKYNCTKIPFKNNNFNGIFSHMKKELGENPVTKGFVEIEDSFDQSKTKSPCLIDPSMRDKSYCWVSSDAKYGSFVFDFKKCRVSLDGYSLKAPNSQWTSLGYLKSWVIEGSNDKKTWNPISDRQTDELSKNYAEKYFSCKKSDPFRFIRIRMTDKNSFSKYDLGLYAIEFFGDYFD